MAGGGVLHNGKPYEINARWAARCRSAATRAGSMYEWGAELMESVGRHLSDLPLSDRLWWREACEGSDWSALREATNLEEIIAAAGVLAEAMTRRNGLALLGGRDDDETAEEAA